MSRKSLERATARYTAEFAETAARSEEFTREVTSIIDDAGINYLSVTGRAKSAFSFGDKVARRVEQLGTREFDPFVEITDQIGIRVITYVQSDIEPVSRLLTEHFTVLDDRDMGLETASEGRFGYASRHMLISRDPRATAYEPHRCASVQLRTVLQHAWAEFEHDARYKGSVPPEHGPALDRRFTLAAGLIELADREFSTIQDTLNAARRVETFDTSGTRIDPRDLASFLAGWYEESGFSRTDQYVWVASLLTELEITSVPALRDVLQHVDTDRVTRAMGYRQPPGAVRRLDDDLLAHFRDRYVDLPANTERRDALRGRSQRLGAAPGPTATGTKETS